ncbi:hypothetical protein ACK336_03050 [Aeromonas veronii]
MIAVEQQVESVGKYHRYGQYVSSGYAYLPEVPVHWKILRNRQLFHFKKRPVGKRAHQYQLLSLTLKGIIPRDIESGKGKIPAEFDTYQVVEPNNIVFCLFDIDETPRTVGLSSQNGMVTGAYAVAEVAKEHCPEFVYYYYLHLDEFKGLRPFYTGLRKVVRPETFMGLSVPTPPQEEQRTIAAFLDYETARIDRLIALQQSLIELLKEKRQAVISHAVTKGLNPDAPMKDSGVEWIGQVPEHWNIFKGAWLGKIFSSEVVTEDDVVSEGDIAFVKVSTLSLDGLQPQCPEWFISSQIATRVCAKSNYIAFPKRGAAIFTNKVNIVPYLSVIDPNVMGWEIKRNVNATFIAYCLKIRRLDDIADVSTVPQINNKHISPQRFPVPPYDEQNEIVKDIEKKMVLLDKIESKVRNAILLMQERRTALISAAVTGKIDLRGWTTPVDEVVA